MFEAITESTLTRKQFLLVIASFLLGFVGLKQLLKNSQPQRSSHGFGGGTYGGR